MLLYLVVLWIKKFKIYILRILSKTFENPSIANLPFHILKLLENKFINLDNKLQLFKIFQTQKTTKSYKIVIYSRFFAVL